MTSHSTTTLDPPEGVAADATQTAGLDAANLSRAWRWSTVAVLFFSAIDPARLGLAVGGSFDVGWWAFTVLLYAPGAFVLSQSLALRSVLVRAPLAPLAAAVAWVTIVSLFGRTGLLDLVTALGFCSVAALGAWAASDAGWDWFVDRLGTALLALLALGVPAQLLLVSSDRWQGLTSHANRLGVLAALAVPVALVPWSRAHGLGSRRRGLALGALAVPSLVLADARMSMVAATVGAAIWARPVLGRALPAMLVVAGLGAAAVVVRTDTTTAVFQTASRSGDASEIVSFTGRTSVWPVVMEEITQRPVTGIGAAATKDFMASDEVLSQLGWDAGHAHNVVLQMALHGGTPAAMLLVTCFIAYWWSSRVRPRSDRDALVLVLVVVGVTEDLIVTPGIALVVFGAALASASSDRLSQHRDRGRQDPAAVYSSASRRQ